MQTQLFFDLMAPDGIKVHFCEPEAFASLQPELTPNKIAALELEARQFTAVRSCSKRLP
jgi:hypothetical protein